MPTVTNSLTALNLSGIGVPPYSARGINQTAAPINESADLKRTVNGALKDLSDPLFRKYASAISGTDVDPPALEGVWPGLILDVDCVFELSQPESTGYALARAAVPGSVRTEAGFIFYRPRLTMMVTGFNWNRSEYGGDGSWTINLEEV